MSDPLQRWLDENDGDEEAAIDAFLEYVMGEDDSSAWSPFRAASPNHSAIEADSHTHLHTQQDSLAEIPVIAGNQTTREFPADGSDQVRNER